MSQRRAAAAARILMALLVASTPGLAGGVHFQRTGDDAPTVQSTVVLGSVVAVTVSNTSRDPKVVTVEVVAVVDGATVASTESLSVPPRDDATASVDFSGPVDEVVQVGLVEGGDPY